MCLKISNKLSIQFDVIYDDITESRSYVLNGPCGTGRFIGDPKTYLEGFNN